MRIEFKFERIKEDRKDMKSIIKTSKSKRERGREKRTN
jgi:hypothetical protein